MKDFNILVVDDERVQRETLAEILRDQSYQVSIAEDVPSAEIRMDAQAFDVILTDFRMPGGSGLDIARHAMTSSPSAATLIMTAYADVQGVIAAMRVGAVDYLLKPIDVDHLLRQIHLIEERKGLRDEVKYLRAELARRVDKRQWLLGTSGVMRELENVINQVALSRGTVLITGESGTGKEMAARQIHASSPQSTQKFVAINCGAIPEQLLESELFGHKKGSFTGAVSDKVGLFTVANGGTLFLDEIGELPKGLQVKLLRAIQEREIVPVGDTVPKKFEVRLITATNRDLAAEVQAGNFRSDLYYRINVVELKMPPLREHPSDIPTLIQHFIGRYSREIGKPINSISTDALQHLASYSWPGNVRELENVIERSIILSRSGEKIEVCDLPPSILDARESAGGSTNLEEAVQHFSRQHITKVLQACGGDKKECAKALGVGLSSLYRKLEDLGLSTKKLAPEGV